MASFDAAALIRRALRCILSIASSNLDEWLVKHCRIVLNSEIILSHFFSMRQSLDAICCLPKFFK